MADRKLRYQENPNGIAGGAAIMTGNLTVSSARDLALVLNSSPLPISLRIIKTSRVN